MTNKSVIITPVGVLEALPKIKRDIKGNKISKLLTMYKPKDTKRYPMEHVLHTYVYVGKQYPYNSKKRGWNVKSEEKA